MLISNKSELLPREKALAYGLDSLENAELLALVIKSAYAGRNVLELSRDIINIANGFDQLLSLTYEELITIKGIKNAKALEIMAILEICKRLSHVEHVSDHKKELDSKMLVDWLRFSVGFKNQEEFVAVFIDNKGRIIRHETLFKGSRNMTVVGVDELMRKAILARSAYLVIGHNHPGADCHPSNADLLLTKQIKEAASLMQIGLLDHLIVSPDSYFSFKKEGLL